MGNTGQHLAQAPTRGAAFRSLTPLPRTLADFRNFHAGETILVCGCGTSLLQVTEPNRCITIGVNDVGRMFQPDYLIVLNPKEQFHGDRFRFVENSQAKALFTQLKLPVCHPHIVPIRLGKFGGVDFADPTCVHYTRNSPYLAMCLAIHMGAKRIGLIGVDFTNDHFFANTGQHPLARQFPQIDQEYKKLYTAATKLGIEVFNLSPCSRLTALPKMAFDEFAPPRRVEQSLNIVSYSTTPVAGVPAILARCIASRTAHKCRAVWASNAYGNGVCFEGDVQWDRDPVGAEDLLKAADLVIVHNGKVHPRHRSLLQHRAVLTMAHNYIWNVDTTYVGTGHPGVVVGQYQATLPEFRGWSVVPNPVPLWEPAYSPQAKNPSITICYTPSGKHESYPRDHRLYWHSKGYATTLKVLRALSRRYPLQLEVVDHHQVTHAQSLAMKAQSHIVIDECVTGSYHRNSLEGLACGCAVLNGLGSAPAIAAAFRQCSGCSDIPFVLARLDDLEAVLSRLIESGAERLLQQGAHNRWWMEQHWDFRHQWHAFWQPTVEAALNKTRDKGHSATISASIKSIRTEALVSTPSPGVSVVVCHGGAERLHHLRTSLTNLRACDGIDEIIVADMGVHPCAKDIARRHADKYLFIRNDDAFERARCLNSGTALAECDLVLWLDNDLIVPREFVSRAVAELRARQLDYIIPYTAVCYLGERHSRTVLDGVASASECAPEKIFRALYVCGGAGLVRKCFVETYGGLSESFRGWGGEDGAWWHKARLLGRAEVTRHRDQYLYHLFHVNSGANGGSQHRDSNPYYSDNLAILNKLRSVRDRQTYLKLFPPNTRSSLWEGKEILALYGPSDLNERLAARIAQHMSNVTGARIETRSLQDLGSTQHFDAVIVLGITATMSFFSNQSLRSLWDRAIVVSEEGLIPDQRVDLLTRAFGILGAPSPQFDAFQNAGIESWSIPHGSSPLSHSIRIIQPLSLIIGGAMPEASLQTSDPIHEETPPCAVPASVTAATLSDITVLITSFLRPGYLNDCLAGIAKNLPECKVIVVDDSAEEKLGSGSPYPFIHLPFDSGLSAKRNAGVAACSSRYLLMGADDFDFSTTEARAGIEKLLAVLEENRSIDVAGGHHNNHCYEGFLDWAPGSHIKETRLFADNDPSTSPNPISDKYQAYKVDLIANYFLARSDSIRPFPWDERMKIGGEHGDWFLTLKDAGKTVAWVKGVNINELPRDPHKEHPHYGHYRGRALSLGHKIFLEKRGIKHYVCFDEPLPNALKPRSNTLIAVITCKGNVHRVRALQETWIPKAIATGYDVQIFDGERLGVPDDYYSLIDKTQALCRWALTRGYERMLKVDDDCCIRVGQLRPNAFDYAGIIIGANDAGSKVPPGVPDAPKGTYPHSYASGGAYWLSRKAMRMISDAQPNGDWAEDRFVGHVLARHGIFVRRIPDFAAVSPGSAPRQWVVLTQLPDPAQIRRAFYRLASD